MRVAAPVRRVGSRDIGVSMAWRPSTSHGLDRFTRNQSFMSLPTRHARSVPASLAAIVARVIESAALSREGRKPIMSRRRR
jgi:hypothetical protein